MATTNLIPAVLRTLARDAWLLFVTRFARLFAYGSLSVILVFYLLGLGLTEVESGLVLTLTLAGDVVVSLLLTTRADRVGRRRMLVIGAILMAAAGLAFASTRNLFFLILAGTIGDISPSGNEVGPFLSIEQAALTHIVPATARTEIFAWYTLTGSLATRWALCSAVSSPRRCNRLLCQLLRVIVQSCWCTPHWGSCWHFSSLGCRLWWRWARFRRASPLQQVSQLCLELLGHEMSS